VSIVRDRSSSSDHRDGGQAAIDIRDLIKEPRGRARKRSPFPTRQTLSARRTGWSTANRRSAGLRKWPLFGLQKPIGVPDRGPADRRAKLRHRGYTSVICQTYWCNLVLPKYKSWSGHDQPWRLQRNKLRLLGMSEYAERFKLIWPFWIDQYLKDLGVLLGHRLKIWRNARSRQPFGCCCGTLGTRCDRANPDARSALGSA
jgi:hypothetical protein